MTSVLSSVLPLPPRIFQPAILPMRSMASMARTTAMAILDTMIIFLSLGSSSSSPSYSCSCSPSSATDSSVSSSSSSSSGNRSSNCDGGITGTLALISDVLGLTGGTSVVSALSTCLPVLIISISCFVISMVGDVGTLVLGTTIQSILGFSFTLLRSAISAFAVRYRLSGFFCVHFLMIFSRLVGISG